MDPRPALHELAVRYSLSPAAAEQLQCLADRTPEPPGLKRTLPLGIAVLAAALGGLGIVFWIAANWDTLGRSGKFALLQSVILIMCAGALLLPRARVPLGLTAFMAIGGLFAFFGQTYQTGADAWQLFALWAALALPLCLGVRHDALWAPWALVVMTAVTLWVHAKIGYSWDSRPGHTAVHLVSWLVSSLLVVAMSPVLRRYTGAGPWAMRTALVFAAMLIAFIGLDYLFDRDGSDLLYFIALATLGGAMAAFCSPRLHDIFALSAVGLSLNVMLVSLLVNLLLNGPRGDRVPELAVIAIAAAAMLAGTVHFILKQSRRGTAGETA